MTSWDNVSERARELAEKSAGTAHEVRRLVIELPKPRHTIVYNPDENVLHVGLDKEASDEVAARWAKAGLDPIPLDVKPQAWGEAPWVLIKRSADPVMATMAKLTNFQPWAGNALLGGPNPLAATLAGGLLGAGAGLGYGTATDEPYGEINRPIAGALLGGLAGAAPGALWGLTSMKGHPEHKGKLRSLVSGWPFRDKDSAPPVSAKEACAALETLLGEKVAFSMTDNNPLSSGVDMLSLLPAIDHNSFMHDVWHDQQTPLPIRAATVGLLNNAQYAAGGERFLSPYSIAQVSDDFHRGLLVGKSLGALANLGPEASTELKRQGVWANILTKIVPQSFPDETRLF